MSLHRFIATPIAASPVLNALQAHLVARSGNENNDDASDVIEIPFEQYYGIGTFPIKTTDKLYREIIIQACKEKYGFDLTPYYYPETKDGEAISSSPNIQLFDVTDLTARASAQHNNRFKLKMLRLKEHNDNSHSSYFYIFIRPIQIAVIVGIIGYCMYRMYINEMRLLDEEENVMPREEQEESRYRPSDTGRKTVPNPFQWIVWE